MRQGADLHTLGRYARWMRTSRLRHSLALVLLAALLGCAAPPRAASTAPVLIFGEQHDQLDQQRQVAEDVARLAAAGQLAAVVLEMAEAGRDTRGVPRDADEARVREALAWARWPWETYAAVVMNAVRAGVPVVGGNLPRAEMRAAMSDAVWDTRLDARARGLIADAVREGHCGLLPAEQEPGMVRVQVARDISIARTVEAALAGGRAGQRVLLLTGGQHASRDRGVPRHLRAGLAVHVVMFGDELAGMQADERRPFVATERPDPCEALRERLKPAG
jgi:uncharacterized iron-regulated protein